VHRGSYQHFHSNCSFCDWQAHLTNGALHLPELPAGRFDSDPSVWRAVSFQPSREASAIGSECTNRFLALVDQFLPQVAFAGAN
jgi:hypothetical protein